MCAANQPLIHMSKSSKQKVYLWKKDPHCKRCGVLTVLPKDVPGDHIDASGCFSIIDPPDNMATIQHPYNRTHPLRKMGGRHLLWCYKCNQEYNDLYEQPNRKKKKKRA